MALQTLNLIGAGRVGQTLGRLWADRNSLVVQDVLTRSPGSAQAACAFMGVGRAVAALSDMRNADLWMLAEPDAHLPAAALALAAAGQPTAVAFHCSGALGAHVLDPLAQRGWQTASAHCILSFTTPQESVAQFAQTPCALEGMAGACAQLQAVFSDIGALCFALESDKKLLYHAAAVFATNFLPVLQDVAEAAWQDAGVPAALLDGLRTRLLRNAVANIERLGPAGALTGPAARGDVEAIARQELAVMAWDPAAGAAYGALSALALRMAKTSRDAAATSASST